MTGYRSRRRASAYAMLVRQAGDAHRWACSQLWPGAQAVYEQPTGVSIKLPLNHRGKDSSLYSVYTVHGAELSTSDVINSGRREQHRRFIPAPELITKVLKSCYMTSCDQDCRWFLPWVPSFGSTGIQQAWPQTLRAGLQPADACMATGVMPPMLVVHRSTLCLQGCFWRLHNVKTN